MCYHRLKNFSAHRRKGRARGLLSICTADPRAIDAVLSHTVIEKESWVLVEATASQVNPDGGYTGMTPDDFVRRVKEQASAAGLHHDRFLLGGDHLGPYPWRHLSADTAMEKGCELVSACVDAGMVKLHLDAAAPCLGDPVDANGLLPPELVARRCARLARTAEAAFERNSFGPGPLYVIGTDVPLPGGAYVEGVEVHITDPDDLDAAIRTTRECFDVENISGAWERVVAVVVQPGVDFTNRSVIDYCQERAAELSKRLRHHPNLVFEAHSTDFQKPTALREMVEDGFAILKVGPWLTFAFREAVFALSFMEETLTRRKRGMAASHLPEVLDRAMVDHPVHWEGYYRGSASEKAFQRKYALSDRCRYYWSRPEVEQALVRLLENLRQLTLPLSLVSQYLPAQFAAVRCGEIENTPEALIRHKIREVVHLYDRACRPEPVTDQSAGASR